MKSVFWSQAAEKKNRQKAYTNSEKHSRWRVEAEIAGARESVRARSDVFSQAVVLRRFARGKMYGSVSIEIIFYSVSPNGRRVERENRKQRECKGKPREVRMANCAFAPKKVPPKKVGQWRRRMQNGVLHLSAGYRT